MDFLEGLDLRRLQIPGLDPGLRPVGLVLGQGAGSLEVAIIEATSRPTSALLRTIWRSRWNNRPAPVVLAALTPEGVALCGLVSEGPVLLPRHVSEQICRVAL